MNFKPQILKEPFGSESSNSENEFMDKRPSEININLVYNFNPKKKDKFIKKIM